MSDLSPLLSLRGVDKRFPGAQVLRGVDLDFFAGEIHAVVGENGAGKSTLIKILTGAYRKSAGKIFIDGQDVELSGPGDALQRGIAAIHQEVILCPHLTVAANLFLGSERTSAGLVRDGAMRKAAMALLADLGFDIPADAILGDLTNGQQQLVAAARAATRKPRLVVFDEPTAYLTHREADQLFTFIRRIHSEGVAIVYISHRLEEIVSLALRVSVLRDGQLISTRAIHGDTSQLINELVHDMVARNIGAFHVKEKVPILDELLRVKGFSGTGFSDISLDVRRGEIVGLYGLVGSGRSEFVQSLFGRHGHTGGEVVWKGMPTEIRSERDAIKLGMALLPESRREQGLCLNQSLRVNLNLTDFETISPGGLVQQGAERRRADEQVRSLSIAASSQELQVARLSGGNQQKVVIGKWLIHGAELYIADEPMAGIDVATKSEICRLFASLLAKGAAIILISSYLPEVYDLSDRLHVFRSGRIVASFNRGQADHAKILAAAIGA